MTGTPTVLFVCVHNAGRSQMAAGWLSHLAGHRIEVRSAGSQPAGQINPLAAEAMREVGIDITGEQPKVLTTDAVRQADVVVTMGCGDAWPVLSRQALRGLAARRSGRPVDRGRPRGSRRDQAAHRDLDRRAAPVRVAGGSACRSHSENAPAAARDCENTNRCQPQLNPQYF